MAQTSNRDPQSRQNQTTATAWPFLFLRVADLTLLLPQLQRTSTLPRQPPNHSRSESAGFFGFFTIAPFVVVVLQ